MLWILAALIIFPILEISIIIQSTSVWGVWITVIAIFATALIGSVLVRSQGIAVVNNARQEFQEGRLPARQVLEGLFLLLAAVLLVTPGFLSDSLGFLALMPIFRNLALNYVTNKIRIHAKAPSANTSRGSSSIIEGQFVEITDHNN